MALFEGAGTHMSKEVVEDGVSSEPVLLLEVKNMALDQPVPEWCAINRVPLAIRITILGNWPQLHEIELQHQQDAPKESLPAAELPGQLFQQIQHLINPNVELDLIRILLV